MFELTAEFFQWNAKWSYVVAGIFVATLITAIILI